MVTRQYWPAVGGVERVVENLGQAYVERGHETTVIAQCIDELHFGRMTHVLRERKLFAPFTHRGMPVVQFRPSRRRRALLLPLAAELIPLGGRISDRWLRAYSARYYSAVVGGLLQPLLGSADVVHVLGSNLLAVASVRAAHALGKPVAISPFAHIGEWGDDSASRLAYHEADALLATTVADADGYAGLGVDSAKIHNVGLPVPDALDGLELPDEPPLPGDVPVVLFLGQRRPTKRYELVLEAAEAVWRRHPDAHFAFVGPGRPLGSGDPRILDVGRVSDAERGAWLRRATLLCLPSRSETFGMVVAEAWSQRLPVVVSDIPVLRELVEDSGGGLVAGNDVGSFAESIASLLDDRGLARSLGASGRSYWERRLTPAAVAERHLQIYETMLA
ncbi:MAG: glycosyl transferase group 1 [Solirubrobacterales bacterium]|nr:glycosyl transferase group 1 [Solirubrobacterales bacterium]